MNLPKQCKPDSCVSKYPFSSIFGNTYVDVDGEGGGSVYASNKQCAAWVPLGPKQAYSSRPSRAATPFGESTSNPFRGSEGGHGHGLEL